MGIGVSLFLVAVGAILTFAVESTVQGIDVDTIGVILMAVGGLGLLFTLFVLGSWNSRHHPHHEDEIL